ncbi:KTSC domain-containing protein [Streptomyces sp. NPDC053542]|uniref:KTSC domain-containing protein n=1 Tax=Streptomyces sp. NPDC053542 TaxID=3365710 RepID=UPI0037D98B2A
MLHRAVVSSHIRSVAHDAEERILEIQFQSGATYQYINVPANVHADLMKADSKGTYLAKFIKGKYAYRMTRPALRRI